FINQWDIIPLIFYFPFGVCLLVIRIFIGLHAFIAASLLPKTSTTRLIVVRTMCAVLGFIVREEDVNEKCKTDVKVLVSNHVTNFDHLAVELVLPCVVPSVWDLPKYLNWCLGFYDFGVKQGREVLTQNVKNYLSRSEVPILSHPEGATTNGRVGLLKFSTWPFSLEPVVHPIIISVNRPPPIKVTTSVLGSRWWSDLLWILLTPCTVFTLRYLRPIKKEENETVKQFSQRVQKELARVMNVDATSFTDQDKVEYAKRLFHSSNNQASLQSNQSVQRNATISSNSPRESVSPIDTMAIRVKEVLPQVPIDVIKKDLGITTNIDETISRLLDGTTVYVSEQAVKNDRTALREQATDKLPKGEQGYDTSAKTFGKNASERMQSYKERKSALIEAARVRYLRKHPEILKKL
ncbi:ancient ubiquitous protein 1-like protein, partial [Leptotrombidium deliense]